MSISPRNLNSGSDLSPTADPSGTNSVRANALSQTVPDLSQTPPKKKGKNKGKNSQAARKARKAARSQ